MTTRNGAVRFCQNNYAASPAATLTASSYVAGFPVENLVNPYRWKKLIFQGAFKITSANKKIYISDGSNKTITLTEATYASGTLLAAHIQTQLNASSSLWTCTYSNTTYKFTIGRSTTTRSLRFTQTTDAAWDTLGYVQVSDTDPSTGLAADEVRIHTSETVTIDMGLAVPINAFMVVWDTDTASPLSSLATVTLKIDSVNTFTAPTISRTPSVEDTGIFDMLDDEPDTTFRYLQLEIRDRTNPAGPQIALNQLYAGTYITPSNRDLNIGFNRVPVDPSSVQYSYGGTPYFRRQKRYWEYSALMIEFLKDQDRVDIENMMAELGKSTPLFVVLDPLVQYSNSLGEFTKYMFFESDPSMRQLFYNNYSIDMTLREIV